MLNISFLSFFKSTHITWRIQIEVWIFKIYLEKLNLMIPALFCNWTESVPYTWAFSPQVPRVLMQLTSLIHVTCLAHSFRNWSSNQQAHFHVQPGYKTAEDWNLKSHFFYLKIQIQQFLNEHKICFTEGYLCLLDHNFIM